MDPFLKARDNHLDFFYKNPIYLDTQDELGHSLLHYAIFGNAKEVFFYLLNNNINTNLVNKRGETPLFDAVRKNKKEMVISLLNKYAKVNVINKNLETPLFIALNRGNLEIVKLLIENGAKLDNLNKQGESVLFAAIRGGSIDCYEYIRLLSPKILKIDNKKNTQLHLACSLSSHLMVNHLLKNEENPHLVNDQLETAIFSAVRAKHLENVKILTSYGAYIDLTNKYSHSLFDLATDNEDLAMLEFLNSHKNTSLYKRNLKENLLRYAILKRNNESVIKYKNKSTKDKYHFSALDYAYDQNNDYLVKLLKED